MACCVLLIDDILLMRKIIYYVRNSGNRVHWEMNSSTRPIMKEKINIKLSSLLKGHHVSMK